MKNRRLGSVGRAEIDRAVGLRGAGNDPEIKNRRLGFVGRAEIDRAVDLRGAGNDPEFLEGLFGANS